jgi:uncharacterized protein YqjF (DUF2071 family)
MNPPVMVGNIERRILVNFRVDPDVAAGLLPQPFRPSTTSGHAIVGICLIRLGQLRPRGVSARLGVTTENAAHRIAVVWDSDAGPRHGVYIPRRDTSSRLSVLVGGRMFPGEHHRARIRSAEHDGSFDVSLLSVDRDTSVEVSATTVGELPPGSVFGDLETASRFFFNDPVGYSETRHPGRYDGIELETERWEMSALNVERVSSSFFGDARAFPTGSIEFDSALLMRPTAAIWKPLPQLDASSSRGRSPRIHARWTHPPSSSAVSPVGGSTPTRGEFRAVERSSPRCSRIRHRDRSSSSTRASSPTPTQRCWSR